MVRICACFGAGLDVIEPCGFPFSVKAVRRSAMDYAEAVDIVRHDDWAAFNAVRQGRLVLMTTVGSDPLWECDLESGDTLLMGRESAGVPAEVHEAADLRLRIPLQPAARSLNVAVAAGIALAHAQRCGALPDAV